MTVPSLGAIPATVLARRSQVVATARSWLGTPFHHGARLKGTGVDCGQFLIAVYSECGLVPDISPRLAFYAPDWFMHTDDDRLLEWVAKFCYNAPRESAAPGDIVLFRYGRSASHGAIVLEWGEEGRVIHAFRGAGVIEEECRPGTPLFARLHSAWRLSCLV